MSKKDTIYIDVEDDITTLINKTKDAVAPIVALVLPKRYATLQSSVNMKLLKKASDDAKKKLVLITTELSLMPLAAAAKIHVAKSLNSRPEIPAVDTAELDAELYGEEPAIDETASLEDLASAPLKTDSKSDPTASDERRKVLDKIKWPGRLKVPNFSRFRTKAFLISFGVILLAVGYYVAFWVLPKSTVAITAETSNLPTSLNFSASLNAEGDDFEAGVLKASVKELKKTVSENFQATGEKDVGQKASGTMEVQNCDSSEEISVPSGTVFVDDTTGFEFVSTANVTVPGGSFSGGGCDTPGTANVGVQAVESGDTRNLSPRGYFVEGFSQFVTGFGAQMSGGTSEIVKVVTQEDFERASRDLLNREDSEVLVELTSDFGDDVLVLGETFQQKAGTPKSSPEVGAEATEARVTAEFTYTIVAVPLQSMTQLVETWQNQRLQGGDQAILDNGLGDAAIELIEADGGVYRLSLETTAIIGPQLDTAALAQEITGKRYSEIITIIEGKSGVRDVEVEFSPPWIFSAPEPSKIEIIVNINEPSGETNE